MNSFFLHGIPNDLAKSNTPREQCSFILQFHEYFRFRLKSASQIFLNELEPDVPFQIFELTMQWLDLHLNSITQARTSEDTVAKLKILASCFL